MSYQLSFLLPQREQTNDHQQRLQQLEADLDLHTSKPPDKQTKSNAVTNYREKETYLSDEVRHETYLSDKVRHETYLSDKVAAYYTFNVIERSSSFRLNVGIVSVPTYLPTYLSTFLPTYLACVSLYLRQIKRYRAYVYLLRSRLTPAASTNGNASDLPVLHADGGGGGVVVVVAAAASPDTTTPGSGGGNRGNGRLVPPPIPDRVVLRGAASTVPGDRYSYQEAVTHNAIV